MYDGSVWGLAHRNSARTRGMGIAKNHVRARRFHPHDEYGHYPSKQKYGSANRGVPSVPLSGCLKQKASATALGWWLCTPLTKPCRCCSSPDSRAEKRTSSLAAAVVAAAPHVPSSIRALWLSPSQSWRFDARW